ncbi:prephenate dehydrogenase/arogenate dehydrogenase family protein [Oceanicola sp. S124]|uniref:prephenate dehydrogenase/arogenate dehydrogenase family protein n=1 Tax=Oceanicola sp. S124 TaxID=1042378 RepID=UPI000255A3F7|nr:prephenate dehydrogenase/arogenate dehydrogenase family protein [Oceanicola sp. S124]
MPPSLSLFGFGAFGQLLAPLLATDTRLTICDPLRGAEALAAGYEVVSTEIAARADILLLAVPLPVLPGLLQQLAPHLRPGQVVIDTCSVKEEPARLMRALLPDGVVLIGSHPMFGPVSAREGLRGSQVVLCPLRGGGGQRLAAYLRARHGLRVIVTTPEQHDAEAALSQGLTHLLGRAMAGMGPAPRIRTRSFELMMEALSMVAGDAPEVYDAVTAGNRHLGPLRARLAAALAPEGGGGAPDSTAG